jgi:hypothetical protein
MLITGLTLDLMDGRRVAAFHPCLHLSVMNQVKLSASNC